MLGLFGWQLLCWVCLLEEVLAAGLLSSQAPSLVPTGSEDLAGGELPAAETRGGDCPRQG